MPFPDPDPADARPAATPLPASDFWLHDLPGHRVRRLHQRLVAEFNAIVAARPDFLGVTPMQFAALAAIDHRPGCDQATVGRLAGCDKVTCGQLLERMDERGWIERQPDPNDRRARTLNLTATGRALLERVRAVVLDGPLRTLPPLTAAERDTLMALLERLTMPFES